MGFHFSLSYDRSWAGGERREAETVTGGGQTVERSPRPPEYGENRAGNGVRGTPSPSLHSVCLPLLRYPGLTWARGCSLFSVTLVNCKTRRP